MLVTSVSSCLMRSQAVIRARSCPLDLQQIIWGSCQTHGVATVVPYHMVAGEPLANGQAR